MTRPYIRGPLTPFDPRHGIDYGYWKGCRCQPCTTAHRHALQDWKANRPPLPVGDPRHGTHNGYNNYACRCDPCLAAGSALNRQQRLRRKANR